jgi:hypothetical protein
MEPILGQMKVEKQFGQMIGGIKARLGTMRARTDDDNTFLLAESDTF